MDYQGNSHKLREAKEVREDKVVTQIVTSEVIVTPPGLGKRIKGIFFGGEFKDARGYVIADVLLPAARNTLLDMIIKGSERAILGVSAAARGRQPEMRSRVQYGSMYNRPYQGGAMLPNQPPRPIVRTNYRESPSFLITDRGEANDILERMVDIVDKYDVASLADLLVMLGQPVSAIDHKWGWTLLNGAEVRQVRSGYMLEMPPMEEI
jgi:hypothetical protein